LGFDAVYKAADEDPHEGDLVAEAVTEGRFEVGEFELGESLGVEAVFEGVGVAWLRASGTFGHTKYSSRGESVVVANRLFIILYIFFILIKGIYKYKFLINANWPNE